MSEVIGLVGSSVEVSTYAPREQVVVEMEDGHSNVTIFITPGDAVRISRALVKAAAEALGTSVEMPRRTKEEMLLSIRTTAATLPNGPL